MQDIPNDTAVATTVRLDRQLRRQIEEAAEASERSVSREVVYRLRRTFETQSRAAA
jgi:predicted transcriptional regulator